jgi:DNA mismatch endonuclease, patch repair protein
MVDVFTKEKRSEVMSKIRSKDTNPELRIRKGLHRLGYRYRLNVRELPGKPDLLLPKYRTAIQVRGCFWHGHVCNDGHRPKTREDYWTSKLAKNVDRDRRNDERLQDLGWRLIIVWECHCSTRKGLEKELKRISKIKETKSF